jgi:hypothetical protein
MRHILWQGKGVRQSLWKWRSPGIVGKMMATILKRVFHSIRSRVSRFGSRIAHVSMGIRSRLVNWRSVAHLVKHMAETGDGTEKCLKLGCLPMSVHYYSPVPDIEDLHARGVFQRKSKLPGVDMRISHQLELLAELGKKYGEECQWPHECTGDDQRYHTSHSGFSYGCAAALHSMIRKHRPRRIFEIGSGGSSRVISAALVRNHQEGGHQSEYTIIDPYPAETTRTLPGITRLLEDRVEAVGPGIFQELDNDDILFVDSGHTVRVGGDVNFLLLDVVPAVHPGVIVHVHDIPMPYEYAEVYYTNPRFRMLWTESYLLQAFLSHNHAFEILLGMNFLMLDRAAEFRAAWPHFKPEIHGVSHSFWFRRKVS